MNVCYCGAMAGFPHADDCPYPLFRGTPAQENKWYNDQSDLRAWIASGKDASKWEPWE